jgi:hypothetical protein
MGRVIATVMLSVVSGAGVASAQAVEPRFEVGGQASVLRLSDFGTTNAGFGGRLLFLVTDWMWVDGEVTVFPHDEVVGPTTETSVGPVRVENARRRTDALVGVKIGARRDRLGTFFKLRPGITRLYNKRTECVGNGCAVVLMLIAPNRYRTEFALDVGGGVEFYPSPRTIARVELGDTIIRHRSFAPPCPSGCTSHNLSSRIGVGVRF